MTINEANVTINVRDLERSVAFYTSIGMTVKNRWGNYYAQLVSPGIVVGLHPTQESNLKGTSGNVSIGFTVSDFEQAAPALKALSVHFVERKEEGGEFLHFQDPDGTALYFIKPK